MQRLALVATVAAEQSQEIEQRSRSDRPSGRSASLRITDLDGIASDEVMQRFVERYLEVPYHAVLVPNSDQSRDKKELPFMARFFGIIDDVTGDTLSVYFHHRDLRGLKSADAAVRRVPAFDAPVRSYRLRQRPPEDVLLVWPREEFRPRVLGIGRFTPEVRVAILSTLVTYLVTIGPDGGRRARRPDSAERLDFALMRAAAQPLAPDEETRRTASAAKPTRGQVNDWLADLRQRSLDEPGMGYDLAADALKGLLSTSRPKQVWAVATLIAIASLTGNNTVHSIVHDVPENYHIITGWVHELTNN